MSGEAGAAAPGGRLEGGCHLLPVRVYWEDTDAGGIVYHASYLRFLERGRTELLRALGIGQMALLAETGVAFVVRRMTVEFHGAARLDDVLTVATEPQLVSGATLGLRQSVRRGDAELIAAEVTCACIRDGRAARLPAAVKARLGALGVG